MKFWIVFPLLGIVLTDWPWLWAVLALQWAWAWPGWPAAAWPLAWEIVAVLAVEGLLAAALPRPQAARSDRRLMIEGSTLLWLSLLAGPAAGMVIWQGTTGFDAGMRIHGWAHSAVRRVLLRGTRLLLAGAVLTLGALRILPP